MALNTGAKVRPCRDGCGALILIAKAPNGSAIPLEKVGETPNLDMPGKMLHVVEIHHDNCVNPRIPGNRDPMRSHRIAKNEDDTGLPEDQVRWRPHLVEG